MLLNRYQSGQMADTDVVIAQASEWNARRALIQSSIDRQTEAVEPIKAIGEAVANVGNWINHPRRADAADGIIPRSWGLEILCG